MASSTHIVQQLFLWCMGTIYFFAFTSLYFQVPGLYGKNGILPAKLQLKGDELPLFKKFQIKATLLWLSPYFGLDVESGMELLCIVGSSLSLATLVSRHFRNRMTYMFLWILYFSLYQVGQTFLWFQWDILLLETGFLTMFLSSLTVSGEFKSSPHHDMIFWLIKWLLFRLMFASGVVKLTSMCPTWWNLTALNWHYESQCIPMPLAWYAHQLPEWFQKLSVVATYLIEIGIPFLFFAPLRSLRLLSFYCQILLQLLIIMTGNYNFFNVLTVALCTSLLDDDHLEYITPKFIRKYIFPISKKKLTKKERKIVAVAKFLIYWSVVFSMMYWTAKLFNIEMKKELVIESKIGFSRDSFLQSLETATSISIFVAVLAFLCKIVMAFYRSVSLSVGKIQAIWFVSKTALFTCLSVWLFSISLVPFTEIDRNTQQKLWPVIHKWHSSSQTYHIVNSYGLFRRMTGVGGRPELVIEGTNNLNGNWKEYSFLYKPGNVSERLPIVAPHQPRLDWQMWFAALGSYQHNPWFIHLIYKLLHGEKDVLALMGKNPFPDYPPKFIRSRLYTYRYTLIGRKTNGIVDGFIRAKNIKIWWRRDSPQDYTPPLSKNDQSLQKYIEDMGWHNSIDESPIGLLYLILQKTRTTLTDISPTVFILQTWCFSLLTCWLKKILTDK